MNLHEGRNGTFCECQLQVQQQQVQQQVHETKERTETSSAGESTSSSIIDESLPRVQATGLFGETSMPPVSAPTNTPVDGANEGYARQQNGTANNERDDALEEKQFDNNNNKHQPEEQQEQYEHKYKHLTFSTLKYI